MCGVFMHKVSTKHAVQHHVDHRLAYTRDHLGQQLHFHEMGEVKEDLDLRSAGEFLTGALFGLAVLARAGFERTALDNFVDNTMASLSE